MLVFVLSSFPKDKLKLSQSFLKKYLYYFWMLPHLVNRPFDWIKSSEPLADFIEIKASPFLPFYFFALPTYVRRRIAILCD